MVECRKDLIIGTATFYDTYNIVKKYFTSIRAKIAKKKCWDVEQNDPFVDERAYKIKIKMRYVNLFYNYFNLV